MPKASKKQGEQRWFEFVDGIVKKKPKGEQDDKQGSTENISE